jgi:hypothetical protein
VELLEGLCTRLNDYGLWTPSDDWLEKNAGELASSQWVRISGDRRHDEASRDSTLKGAKAKEHAREISGYCASLVESIEDELTAAIRNDLLNETSTEKLLCKTFSSHCRGIKRRKPPSAPAPATVLPSEPDGRADPVEDASKHEL